MLHKATGNEACAFRLAELRWSKRQRKLGVSYAVLSACGR
jgi:hypothetical protein